MGTRRDSYLLLAAAIAAAARLPFLFWRRESLLLADGCVLVAVDALADVAIGGALVEIGRRLGATGRLAAAWLGALWLTHLIGIPLLNLIGRRVTLPEIGLCAGLAAAVAVAIALWPRPDIAPAPASPPPPLRGYLRTRALWGTLAFLFVAVFARVPEMAITHGEWSTRVRVLVIAGTIAGAGVYALACRHMPLARSARLALMLNLFVVVGFARVWDQIGLIQTFGLITLGLVEGFMAAALTDLMLRASPPGHEAFVCALLSATFRAAWEARTLVRQAAGLSVSSMTIVAAIAGVAAMMASGLVPASLLARRDGDY